MDDLFCKGIIAILVFATKYSSCTIGGLSYMDPLDFRPLPDLPLGSDPCNPLYWYPKNIPEYCYTRTTSKPVSKNDGPLPMPIPVPVPQPVPAPVPMMPVIPPPAPIPFPVPLPPPPIPVPVPVPPLPYRVPIAPTNQMIPSAPYYQPPMSPYPQYPIPPMPYPQMPIPYPPQRQAGMVPGIPGIVSPDGGINIMPFSDAYSDLLEKHRNKLLRKRLQGVMRDFDRDHFPRRRSRRYKRIRRIMSN